MKFASRADDRRTDTNSMEKTMRHTTRLLAVLFCATLTLDACDSSYAPTDAGRGSNAPSPTTEQRKTLKERDDVQIVSGTGDILPAVQQYRDLFGGGAPNPNTAGELASGRREINWDGVPSGFTNNDA